MIGCGVVMLAVFVFAGTGYSRSSCNTCQTCEQSRYPTAPAVQDYIKLQYHDGYPGSRGNKRQQVRKLQCMLRVLGYSSGPVDGWYGHSTARAVMLFLADTFQVIGYGKEITENQWNYLVHQVGHRCTKYNKRKTPKPYYYQYQDYSRGQQYQPYQYRY